MGKAPGALSTPEVPGAPEAPGKAQGKSSVFLGFPSPSSPASPKQGVQQELINSAHAGQSRAQSFAGPRAAPRKRAGSRGTFPLQARAGRDAVPGRGHPGTQKAPGCAGSPGRRPHLVQRQLLPHIEQHRVPDLQHIWKARKDTPRLESAAPRPPVHPSPGGDGGAGAASRPAPRNLWAAGAAEPRLGLAAVSGPSRVSSRGLELNERSPRRQAFCSSWAGEEALAQPSRQSSARPYPPSRGCGWSDTGTFGPSAGRCPCFPRPWSWAPPWLPANAVRGREKGLCSCAQQNLVLGALLLLRGPSAKRLPRCPPACLGLARAAA